MERFLPSHPTMRNFSRWRRWRSVPINDAFMLPKRVRTMEQMADLLQAEQTELTQMQRTIAALEQQLNISTSTFLLPRHESLFELPVNTTESLEARRAKVLAKLNTRGTTTVEAIREMVSIVTGCDGAVVEHFSQYAFTVIVYMLFEGVFPDLSELIRQIDEIKPAHLTFDIVGAFRPIGIENKVEVSLYRLKIRSRFANTRGQRVVRFDGEADFDGSILFNQSFSGITFPAMSIRTGFPIREKINGTLTMDSWYAFDGTASFDGSRKFNAQIVQEEF
nr:MAG TPA: tail protein [Caudoviricetes sp.]